MLGPAKSHADDGSHGTGGRLLRIVDWLVKKPLWRFQFRLAFLFGVLGFWVGIPIGILLALQDLRGLEQAGWYFHEGVLSIAGIGAGLAAVLGFMLGRLVLSVATLYEFCTNVRELLVERSSRR